jgi:subtilase family serine protease
MAEGDLSGVVKDLRTAEAAFGEPAVPYTIEPVGVASNDTSGADEWDLDTQYSTGMAGTVKHLYIYDTTSLTDSDIGLEFNKWVSQDVAEAGSASFGECEQFPYLDGLMLTNDEAMNEAAAQGQTMHASAGDTGGQSCAVAPTNGAPQSGLPEVNYPCDSPYIVCVGGTTLFTNTDGTYSNEITWAAGGGGISQFEYAPQWQSCVAPSKTANDRAVPDIAMDADELTGAVVYVGGSPEIVGGTSLSSPLALGVWARLLTYDTKRLGFAAPRLYNLYPPQTCEEGVATPPAGPLADPPYPFHDIYVGANGTVPVVDQALPGWDFTTGLGSYDVSRVASVICSDSDHDCDLPSKDPDG